MFVTKHNKGIYIRCDLSNSNKIATYQHADRNLK